MVRIGLNFLKLVLWIKNKSPLFMADDNRSFFVSTLDFRLYLG